MSDSQEDIKHKGDNEPSSGELDRATVNYIVDMARQQNQNEIHNVDEKLDRNIDDLKDKIDHVNSKIDSSVNSVRNKFDTFDTTVFGNGNIGVFEQLRYFKVCTRIFFIWLLLLSGIRIWGQNLNDIIDTWTGDDSKQIEEVIEEKIDERLDESNSNQSESGNNVEDNVASQVYGNSN